MDVWIVDARDIKDEDSFDKTLLYRTPKIDDFLKTKRDSLFFVTAPKGLGKTFVLKAKSILYVRDGIPLIHANMLVDKPGVGNIIFNKEKINLFSNIENWTNLWTISIYIACIKKLNIANEISGSSKILDTILVSHANNITSIFKIILGYSVSDYFLIIETLNNIVAPFIEKHNSVLAAFIDNVDEYFEKHVICFSTTSSVSGEISKDIWYFSQIGLIESIYQITSKNSHLKIFASIRKEVFFRVSDLDSRSLQYMGSGIELNYSKDEIQDIFILNIKKESDDRLVYPSLKNSKPILSFLGVDMFTSRYVDGKSEKAFDYLYRHTFQRPRDLMLIGREISQISPPQRSVEKLQELVNTIAHNIAREYITEIHQHIEHIDYDKLFGLIDSNILTKQKAKEICSAYNEDMCNEKNCKTCEATHVFCAMYSVGLLGIVSDNLVSKEKIQEFLPSGLKTFEYSHKLRDSDYYLIHPCLYGLIIKNNKNFNPNKINIVAPGYKFDLPTSLSKKKRVANKGSEIYSKLPRNNWATHIHFGAGKLGLGLVVPIFKKNSRVIIIQRPSDQWKHIKEYDFINLYVNELYIGRFEVFHESSKNNNIQSFIQKWKSKNDLFVCVRDELMIKHLLLASNSISTSLGPGIGEILKYLNDTEFESEVNLYPFENNKDSVDAVAETLNSSCGGLNVIPVTADKICSEKIIIENKIIIKTEPYQNIIINGATKSATKIFKTFKGIDSVIVATDKNEYDFYYKRKLYIVNGIHMIAAIYGYLYLYEKKVPYEKWSEYSLSVLLDNQMLYKKFIDFISIQSVRIILEAARNKEINETQDVQLTYDKLVTYGDSVLSRFRTFNDLIVRILNINDIRKLETNYKDRVQNMTRFITENIININNIPIKNKISSADMIKISNELNEKTAELFLQIIKNNPK